MTIYWLKRLVMFLLKSKELNIFMMKRMKMGWFVKFVVEETGNICYCYVTHVILDTIPRVLVPHSVTCHLAGGIVTRVLLLSTVDPPNHVIGVDV